MELTGNEDERGEKGGGVALAHSVCAMHLLSVRAPYFGVSIKISVQVFNDAGIVPVNADLVKKLTQETPNAQVHRH